MGLAASYVDRKCKSGRAGAKQEGKRGVRFMRPVRELRQRFWHFAVEFNNSIVRSAAALLAPLSLFLSLSFSFPLPFAIFVAVSAFSCIASAALKFMSAAAERATRNAALNAH